MEDLNELFTPSHKLLIRFSKIGNIIAWIVLVVYVLLSSGQLLSTVKQFIDTNGEMYSTSVTSMFQEFPVSLINRLLYILSTLLIGVVYWFILKGISLGLRMIVETDLVYRRKSTGKNDG